MLRIAPTTGDPAGISPEITAKACLRLRPEIEKGGLHVMVVGYRSASDRELAACGGDLHVPDAADDGPWPALAVLETGLSREPVRPGRISRESDRLAYLAVERAVELALAGMVDGRAAAQARSPWTR